ncbi:hypothetical protein LSH36_492g08038 [Paralvinella palmiformis]|uniref:Uncharacterized protein n=1 Tax=Paralvinella palmiformis TaxID=53620 RepID=A0AAD9MYN5_9ANNE|nr:hypothetical protein LSH36_492g08038 [Paralvinella palmiformis]
MTTTINTSSAADLDSGERCPVSKMDTGETSIGDINDGRPILHRRTNGGQGTNENRPKSGKILVRKNTPALLPKVDKIYAKDVAMREPALTEEEETSCCSKTMTEEDGKSAKAGLN